ncbi:MAG: TetR/AcrR family transcriptional regulator [Anaerolineales bacterium]
MARQKPKTGDPVRRQVIQARRSQILEASARVFAEKGYHRATTKEIADAAGISEGTIYNYFANKADLLINMLNFLTEKDRWEEQFAGVLQGDFRDSITKIFRERLVRGRANDGFSSAILSEVLIDPGLRKRFHKQRLEPLIASFEKYLRKVIESGKIRPIDVPLAVRVLFGMFMGLQLLRLLGDPILQTEKDAQLAAVISAIFTEGIAVKEKPGSRAEKRGAS